jgi:serine/threonine protein kinase
MYVNLNVSGFGEVDIAEVSDGTKVAIKIIHGEQDSDNIMRVLSEIDAMKRCKHKNVVNFMDAYYHDNQIWVRYFLSEPLSSPLWSLKV